MSSENLLTSFFNAFSLITGEKLSGTNLFIPIAVMDLLEFNIGLPHIIESTKAGLEWATLKQRMSAHLHQSSDTFYAQDIVKAFLINIAAEQVQEVFNMFGLTCEEAYKFNQILQKVEDVCLPRFLIIYSRYKFITCKQHAGKFNEYFQELIYWSDNCEYGDLKDLIIKDSILNGICDETMRHYLLQYKDIDLKQALDICIGIEKKKESKYAQTDTDLAVKNNILDDCVGTSKLKQKGALEFCHANNKTCIHFPNSVSENKLPQSYNSQEEKSDLNTFSEVVINVEKLLNKATSVKLNKSENTVKDSENFQELSVSIKKLSPKSDLSSKNSKKDNQFKNKKTTNSTRELKNKHKSEQLIKKFQEDILTCSKCGVNSVGNSFITHVCEQGFNVKKQFHVKEKKYNCDVCKSSFGNPSHLKVHARLHSGERPFTCDTCGASFSEASKLKAHLRKHTGERPYICEVCQRTFTWTAAYRRHLRTHTGEKPYTCEFCGGSFADFTSLQRHRRTHTKEKPYVCETCDAKFTDPSALKLHKRLHTGERPYACRECNSAFVRSQHLKEHMKLHTGEKPFECKTCGAKFAEASKLKIHQRKHTGEKPYLCKICGSSFAWTAAFTRHMRTHTMEKPYSCHMCDARFADHSTLTRHKRTHTRERPYVCKVCQTDFADNSSLHRHMRIHTGEKSYVCEVCGSTFAVKSYLVRHIRIHTGEKPYNCLTCGAKFSDSSKLNRHKKIHFKNFPKANYEMQSQPGEQIVIELQPQYQQLQPLQHIAKPQRDDTLESNHHLISPQHVDAVQAQENHSLNIVDDLHHPLLMQNTIIPITNVLTYPSSLS